MKCNYELGDGRCIKEVEENNARCEKHMGKKCIICEKPASKDCSVQGQFACGWPLCYSKKCNDEHYGRAHIYYS